MRGRESKRRREARPLEAEHKARCDASKRVKEEGEAKLMKEEDDANREDEKLVAQSIAERTKRHQEVRIHWNVIILFRNKQLTFNV